MKIRMAFLIVLFRILFFRHEPAAKHKVRMLMVGGAAVNFHGYQRHSVDVDFWIDTSSENFENLITVFREMDYDI